MTSQRTHLSIQKRYKREGPAMKTSKNPQGAPRERHIEIPAASREKQRQSITVSQVRSLLTLPSTLSTSICQGAEPTAFKSGSGEGGLRNCQQSKKNSQALLPSLNELHTWMFSELREGRRLNFKSKLDWEF